MIPHRMHLDKPAVVIELKWNKSASGALAQIKEKHYGNALKDYQGNILLVGINYDKATKNTSVSSRKSKSSRFPHLTRCFSLASFNKKIFRHFQGKPSPPLTRKPVNA